MSRTSTPARERCASPSHMREDELQHEYVQLRCTLASLVAEEHHLSDRIEALREESVRFQQNAEVEEECVTNRLLRRLKGVERDVSQCVDALHDEERAVHETAQQIRSVRAQQSEIERQLEEQQGAQMYELQKKLMSVTEQKSHLEHELHAERQRYLEMLLRLLNSLRRCSDSNDHDAAAAAASRQQQQQVPAAASSGGNARSGSSSSSSSGGSSSGGDNNNNEDDKQQQQQHVDNVAVTSTTTTTTTLPGNADAVSPDVHQKIVQLEQRLNKLLQEQTTAMQAAAAHERRCAELTTQLNQVQMDVFLKRAKAAKLADDLREASGQLKELGDVPLTNTSFAGADLSFCVTPNTSSMDSGAAATASGVLATDPVAAAVAAVRERTRELLTTPTPAGGVGGGSGSSGGVALALAAATAPPLPASFAEAMHMSSSGGGASTTVMHT